MSKQYTFFEGLVEVKPKASKKNLTPCEKCGLYKQAKTPNIGYDGYTDKPDILFVPQNPGATEDIKGRPLVGQSGKYLRKVLRELDIASISGFLNVVRCHTKNNATPNARQIKLCGDQFFWKTVYELKPKIMVLLGAVPVKYVLNKNSLDKSRFTITKVNNVYVLATYHPAYILRNRKAGGEFKYDINKAKLFLENNLTKPSIKYEVLNKEDARNYIKSLIQNRCEVAFDIETNGVNPYADNTKMLCCGFYDGERSPKCIFWEDMDIELFKKFAFSKKVKKIMHNGKFDMLFTLVKHNVAWRGLYFDSMLANYLLDETQRTISLQELAWKYVDKCFGWKEMVSKYMPTLEDCPRDILANYVCLDVYYTYKVYKKMYKEIKKENLETMSYLMGKFAYTLTDIEKNKVYINTEFLKDALDKVDIETKKYKDKFVKFAEKNGMKNFNINSGHQLKKLIFEQLEAPIYKRTQTGLPALDKDVIDEYKKLFPEIEYLSEYRKLVKIESTYLQPLVRNADNKGFVYTTFNLTYTKSGRTSSSNPMNFQNIPRTRSSDDGKFNPYSLIKKCFVSRFGDKGLIVEADYSQLELRVLAIVSKDENLSNIFASGGDIHGEVAKLIAKGRTPTKEDRTRAKGVNFGIVYGASAPTIAAGLGVSVQEGERYIQQWYKKFSQAKAWMDYTKRFVAKHGYVVGLFGRKRRIPEIFSSDTATKEKAYRKAVNSPIQGSASDIFMNAVSDIVYSFRKNKVKSVPIIPVHDAIVIDTHKDEFDFVVNTVKTLMENVKLPIETNVPLVVKVEAGENWAELKEI